MNQFVVTRAGVVRWLAGVAALWCGMGAVQAQAEAPYKVRGADGRVTYTDRPPGDARSVRPVGGVAPMAASGEMLDGLPYALRQVAQRYPVVLYAAAACSPCDMARQALQQRGVPFREWQVPAGGGAELERREGTTSLPLLKVGSSKLLGYNASEWRKTLDAAGYPASTTLPPSWRAPAAQPLPVARVAEPVVPPAAPAPGPVPEAPAASVGGFRF